MTPKNNFLYLIIIFFLFTNCHTNRQVGSLPPTPEWVTKKPINKNYYIGIGSAIKTMNVADYQSNAKNKALADLSSDISVNISTKSALHKMENALGYSEDFMLSTLATSKAHLEGYEIVASYENDTHYWIYYRLSKEKYKNLKAQKKQNAMQLALDFYKKGNQNKENNNYYYALTFYLKGLEAIKNYLSESLETEDRGKKILLGNELLSAFFSTLKNINIAPAKRQIVLSPRDDLANYPFVFFVKNEKNEALKLIPIEFNIGNIPLFDNTTQSNERGEVFFSLGRTKPKKNTFVLNATFNMQQFAKQAISDPIFRKIITKTTAPKGKIKVVLSKAKFFIHSEEKNLNKALPSKPIEQKLKKLFLDNGYQLSNAQNEADYTIRVKTNTYRDKNQGKMYYAYLKGEIVLVDKKAEIMKFSIDQEKGVQLNYEKAGLKAYEELNDMLQKFLDKLLKIL